MGTRGRPKAALVLTVEERETLERWARRPNSAQALALRCRIILACAEGATNNEVAARLGVNKATVCKWRGRFVTRRLDGLSDDPRPGAPRTVTDEDVERVVVTTLEQTPADATHWSTRTLGKATGMSQSSVSRIWRAFGLKPHLAEAFKLSTDPQFIDKVRDIVGLYLNPPDGALVLCVDEKSQIQALDRTAPVLPLLPGTPPADVRAPRPELQPAENHAPRASSQPCDACSSRRRPPEDRLGAARPRYRRLHPRRLLARDRGHSGGSRSQGRSVAVRPPRRSLRRYAWSLPQRGACLFSSGYRRDLWL